MSRNSKINRERRQAEQERQGKKVIEWIFWGLILLGIACAVYFSIS